MSKESIFKVVLNTVSKLTWLKGTAPAKNINMKPGKGFNKPVSDHAFDYLKELDDKEFYKLVTLIFKQRGYSIAPVNDVKDGKDNHDSVDIRLEMKGETTFVQYKHWREYEIDIPALEELNVIMEEDSIRHGIVVTTGVFTQDALDYSHGKNMLLINGVDLSQMVATLSDTVEDEVEKEQLKEEMPELEPLCPICSREMIKRTAKKGKNAGNTFWGCSQFPNCRGVVN